MKLNITLDLKDIEDESYLEEKIFSGCQHKILEIIKDKLKNYIDIKLPAIIEDIAKPMVEELIGNSIENRSYSYGKDIEKLPLREFIMTKIQAWIEEPVCRINGKFPDQDYYPSQKCTRYEFFINKLITERLSEDLRKSLTGIKKAALEKAENIAKEKIIKAFKEDGKC